MVCAYDGRESAIALGAGDKFTVTDHVLDREAIFTQCPGHTVWGYLTPVVGEATIGGHRHPRRVYHQGDFRLTGPGVDIRRATDVPSVIRAVSIAQPTLINTLGVDGNVLKKGFARLQRYTFRSELVESVIDRLHAAATEKTQVGTLYLDTLLNAAVLEMWRIAGGSLPESAASGRLSSALLRRIDRHIDDTAGAKIENASLAALAGMPAALFQKVFKENTGQTPYQYVLARRLANAKCLVETSTLSLAEIAYRHGFSSQSHMTDAFRAKLGVTPGSIRRALA
ncbi:MAG: helix-turn-helix transcriptional regulator [Pseudomonadota bacterium]